MTESRSKAKEIALGDELGDIAIKANGVRVEIHTDGSVVAYTKSDVDAYTNASVRVHAPANDGLFVPPVAISDVSRLLRASAEPKVGDRMPAGHPNAGWIYAGISKTTQQPLYVAPKDSGVFQWKEAMAFAAKDGSRVPSREELDQIYDARDQGALKDTFNLTGSGPAGWYWASSQCNSYYAWSQVFSDGQERYNLKLNDSSLRLVR